MNEPKGPEPDRDQPARREPPSMSLQLIREAASLPLSEWPDARVKAVRDYAAPAAKSIHHLAAFLAVCQHYKLDPMTGQLFLIDGQGGPKVCAGRDTWLALSARQPTYLGTEFGAVHEKDLFTLERNASGVIVEHTIKGFDRGPLVGAYAITRDSRGMVNYEVRRYDDYKPLQGKQNWKAYPSDMLINRVLSAVLRKTYGFSGILIEGEDPDESRLLAPPTDPPQKIVRDVKARTAQIAHELSAKADVPPPAEVADAEIIPNEPPPEASSNKYDDDELAFLAEGR